MTMSECDRRKRRAIDFQSNSFLVCEDGLGELIEKDPLDENTLESEVPCGNGRTLLDTARRIPSYN